MRTRTKIRVSEELRLKKSICGEMSLPTFKDSQKKKVMQRRLNINYKTKYEYILANPIEGRDSESIEAINHLTQQIYILPI